MASKPSHILATLAYPTHLALLSDATLSCDETTIHAGAPPKATALVFFNISTTPKPLCQSCAARYIALGIPLKGAR